MIIYKTQNTFVVLNVFFRQEWSLLLIELAYQVHSNLSVLHVCLCCFWTSKSDYNLLPSRKTFLVAFPKSRPPNLKNWAGTNRSQCTWGTYIFPKSIRTAMIYGPLLYLDIAARHSSHKQNQICWLFLCKSRPYFYHDQITEFFRHW